MSEKFPNNGPLFTEGDKITRRKFLKSAAAGVVLMGAQRAESAEKLPKNLVSIIQFESKFSKIDFTHEKKEIDQSTQDLIQKVVELCNNLHRKIDSAGEEANQINFSQKVETSREADVEFIKQSFWKEMQALIPTLPEFSRQTYIHFLVHDLPRKLAPYGIFVKSVSRFSWDQNTQQLFDEDVTIHFQKIDRIDSAETEQWGKKIKRDVIYLSQLTEAGEQLAVTHWGTGQVFYQNVFMNLERIRPYKVKDLQEQQVIQFITEASIEDLYRKVKEAQNPEDMASAIGMMLLEIKRKKEKWFEDEVNNVIVHETSHLVDHSDERFKAAVKPTPSTTVSQEMESLFGRGAHEEINGLLGELRYDTDKNIALQHILYGYSPVSLEKDFMHSRASIWVGSRLISRILQDPKAYDITLDNSVDGVPPAIQVIFQLHKLTDKKDLLEKFAEELRKEHYDNLKENLTENYLSIKTATMPPTLEEKTPWDNLAPYAVAIILSGGAALALKKFFARKNAVKAEEQRVEKARNAKKSKRHELK